MIDAWRLAVGTLTVLRVAPPQVVDRRTAGRAVLLAPLAVLPLAAAVGLVLWVGHRVGVPPLVQGFLAVGVLALGTRCLHLDGLSDTADGLTASYDRERSLQVMHSGTSGPAGGAALLVVLGVQAASFGWLAWSPWAPLVAGALVCASRCALTLTCLRGVPAARPDGLGTTFTGSVSWAAAAVGWAAALAVVAVVATVAEVDLGRVLVAVLLAVGVVLALVRRATTRLGGVTGDVFGAAVELALAVLAGVVAGGAPFSIGIAG